jgi:hypothetical protein
MAGDSKLCRDIEQCSTPNYRADAYVKTAQDTIGIGNHEIQWVSVSEISNIEAGGNRCGWADGERGSHPCADDIGRIDVSSRDLARRRREVGGSEKDDQRVEPFRGC